MTYHFADTGDLPQYSAIFVTSGAADQTGLPGLSLFWVAPLTDSGGSAPLGTGSIEVTCGGPDCHGFSVPQRFVLTGTLEAGSLLGCTSNSSHSNKCAQAPLPYWEATGGKTLYRQATYGTNSSNHSTWLPLANIHAFCEYTSAKDGTIASVFLDTLLADKPTLAGLAYVAQIPATTTPGPMNPASQYCTQLGGTSQFGGSSDGLGGGWVSKLSSMDVMSMCVFPDTSAIDKFALFYHSAGEIRGIDLSTVMRFKPPTGKKAVFSVSN